MCPCGTFQDLSEQFDALSVSCRVLSRPFWTFRDLSGSFRGPLGPFRSRFGGISGVAANQSNLSSAVHHQPSRHACLGGRACTSIKCCTITPPSHNTHPLCCARVVHAASPGIHTLDTIDYYSSIDTYPPLIRLIYTPAPAV